jgi:hypothetical protein
MKRPSCDQSVGMEPSIFESSSSEPDPVVGLLYSRARAPFRLAAKTMSLPSGDQTPDPEPAESNVSRIGVPRLMS